MIDILIDVLLFCVIVALIYWLVTKFLPEPVRSVAVAILVVIAVIIIILYARPMLHNIAAPSAHTLPRR
jgi:hypothetical protein